MILKIIHNDYKNKNIATDGEKRVRKFIEKMYKNINIDDDRTAYLYIDYPISNSYKPDFVIIDPIKGISIIEVKDWSMSYIKNITQEEAELIDRKDCNPARKACKYLDTIKTNLSHKDFKFIKNKILSCIVYTNISRDELTDKNVNAFMSKNIKSCFKNEELDESIFNNEVRDLDLDRIEMNKIRAALYPEISVYKEKKIIDALNLSQEDVIRKYPRTNCMLTGLPGSGKTLILIARAIYTLKENPDYESILIVVYNSSLRKYIEDVISKLSTYLYEFDIKRIYVKTYDVLCQEITNRKIESKDKVEKAKEFESIREDAFIKSNSIEPIYDAVFVDEYQDFEKEWICVCKAVCKAVCKEEGKKNWNMFFTGDRLQQINTKGTFNWENDFGLGMQGKSMFLKESYRTEYEFLNLGLRFLEENKKIRKDVKKYYYDESEGEGLSCSKNTGQEIEFIEHQNIYFLKEKVKSILKDGYKEKDILILCPTKKTIKEIGRILPNITAYTYISSKGLEYKVVILMNVNDRKVFFEEDLELEYKTIYVGITRASEMLIIHSDGNEDSYFDFYNLLKECYEN